MSINSVIDIVGPLSLGKKGSYESTTVSQSVSQLIKTTFFSKTADMIFMKFHIKFWFLQDKKVIQPGKNLILGKKPEISLKAGLFWSCQKIYSIDVLFLGLHDAP